MVLSVSGSFTQQGIKCLSILLLLAGAPTVYSQGTVNFVNRNTTVTPIIDARIWYSAGGPMPSGWVDSAVNVTDSLTQVTYGGASVRVGLYGGPVGTQEKSLVLLLPSVGFGSGADAGYTASSPGSTRALPGVAPGQPAVFQLRGWDAGLAPGETAPAQSYAEADRLSATRPVYLGKSHLVNVSALGGVGSPPSPPAELIGLDGFNLEYFNIPEPSVISLLMLGAIGCLLLYTRKR